MILQFIKSGYANVKQALIKTGSLLGGKIRALFIGKVDEAKLEKLEQLLFEADLGVHYAQELTQKIRERVKDSPDLDSEALINILRAEILNDIKHLSPHTPVQEDQKKPQVILVVGVNGNGKTTSVAKLAHYYHAMGKKVLLGAADTFRAAAIEQLETWAKRLHIEIVKGAPKSDPSAVAFDAVTAGKSRGVDVVIIDTAGRLQTKVPLMQELEKLRRSCKKVMPETPNETLLVLDATTGQNALDQATIFNQYTPLTGLILTKLDGTAKGGVVLAIQRKLKLPIKYIGVGEGLEDLQPFEAEAFVNAIFE